MAVKRGTYQGDRFVVMTTLSMINSGLMVQLSYINLGLRLFFIDCK